MRDQAREGVAQRGGVPIRDLSVAAYTVPTDHPESDGTLAWNATTIVLVHAQAGGETGLGYTYADAAAGQLIGQTLMPLVPCRDAMDISACWDAMRHAIRNLGRPGFCSIDGHCRSGRRLVGSQSQAARPAPRLLLGVAQPSVPVYGSGGFSRVGSRPEWARSR